MSYRKAPTIKDRVVRSYMPAMKRTTWLDRGIQGMFKCGHCNHCENVIQTKSFMDVCTKKLYSIRSFINCKSTHVIYRLQCPCDCFYVGQTKRRLQDYGITNMQFVLDTKITPWQYIMHLHMTQIHLL